MSTIGLCMIVKNETAVLTRCLDSVRPLIDFVMIEDTGSTDGTQDLVRDWLRRNAMPGVVIEEPWRDFAYNRSHVLARLREVETVDYALIIDADDQLVLEPGFDVPAFKATMTRDFYDVRLRHGGSRFHRPQLCSNRKPFCFKAVLHEYLEAPDGATRDTANGFYIETGRGGARGQNPRKYLDDAETLERALRTETDPFLISRYTFYLAQSYRDCGEREKALINYLKRSRLGYWNEEVFDSLCQAAKLQDALEFAEEDVIATFKRAAETVPGRAEAWHGLAAYCRRKGRNAEAYEFARRGLEIPFPANGLFLESWIYDYGLLDELAINAFWIGRHREALDACLRLLEGTALPADQRERIARNARYSLDAMREPAKLGTAGETSLVAQHVLSDERSLRGRVIGSPKVLIAILAKQKEEMLPLYLDCIAALDYPKTSIALYVRTNNNTDGTERILRDWLARFGDAYAAVEFDAADVPEPVQDFGAHEWNATRFRVLGGIRDHSLRRALDLGCDFYFVADVDNFIRPCTLRELLALNLPIVAPLLRSLDPGRFYSNYHAEVDANGYYAECDQYHWILNRWVRGVLEVPVVHTTYLMRADVLRELSYLDDSSRHEYVVFSDHARKAGIPQYLDNRQVYGYIAFDRSSEQFVDGGIELARSRLAAELARYGATEAQALAAPAVHGERRPRVFGCFGQHGSGSTWMFNLAREICRAEGVKFVSVHRDSRANLPTNVDSGTLLIARSQNPLPDMVDYFRLSNEPATVSVRDPRDAVVSFRQRFPNSLASSFEEAVRAITYSAERLVALWRECRPPVFRYEDGFVGNQQTFDRIAALLGVNSSAERRATVLAELTPDRVRRKIRQLEAAGSIRGEAIWDLETQWHANHVGDGRIGKFREHLTADQEAEILERTRDYRECFGYDNDTVVS